MCRACSGLGNHNIDLEVIAWYYVKQTRKMLVTIPAQDSSDSYYKVTRTLTCLGLGNNYLHIALVAMLCLSSYVGGLYNGLICTQVLCNAPVLEGISRGAAVLFRASGHHFRTAGVSGRLPAYQHLHRTRKQLLKLQLLKT